MVVSPRQLQLRKPQNVNFICTQDLSTYIEVWTKRRTRDRKCPVSSWVSGKVRDIKSADDFLTSVLIHKYAYFIDLFYYFATQNKLELVELKA